MHGNCGLWLVTSVHTSSSPLTLSDDISYVKSDSLSLFVFSTCTNSGVLSFIVLGGIELKILEALPWLML